MVRAIKEQVTIQPGGLLEIRRPDLPTGMTVEVIVMIEKGNGNQLPKVNSFKSLFGSVRGCYESGEAADSFIRAERYAWQQ